MSSIMGPIGLEQLELFSPELGKIAAFDIFNSLPNDNFLDWSKLKAFADDKIDVT